MLLAETSSSTFNSFSLCSDAPVKYKFSFITTLPCALARLVSDKPSHIQVGTDTFLWESFMQCGRPKELQLSSLTNLFY